MFGTIKGVFFILCLGFLSICSASRVLELSDRFLDIHKEGQWLIMMYAPWCAQCKRLDPIWAHAAQFLYKTPVRVGKIDCTRFKNVATFFKIIEYPTLIFFKGDEQFIYNGDRVTEEIVMFAQRLSGPPVQEISKTESFDILKKEKDVYFLYIGEKTGSLWDYYVYSAKVFQPYAFFYQSYPIIVNKKIDYKKSPTLVVYKDNTHYTFTGDNITDKVKLNETLFKWVNAERFPTFPKVTQGNIDQLYLTNKNLVLAVVEENLLEELTAEMLDFKTMIETIIKRRRHKYHDHFQFGWIANHELINAIAMMYVPLPSLIVINTTTNHHHIPEDDPKLLTSHAIELFLEQIRNETTPKLGGNGLVAKLFRLWFKIKFTLASMWKGNPVLTLVIFGLPSGFLTLICWQGICCPDFIDVEDEDDDDYSHMKKD